MKTFRVNVPMYLAMKVVASSEAEALKLACDAAPNSDENAFDDLCIVREGEGLFEQNAEAVLYLGELGDPTLSHPTVTSVEDKVECNECGEFVDGETVNAITLRCMDCTHDEAIAEDRKR